MKNKMVTVVCLSLCSLISSCNLNNFVEQSVMSDASNRSIRQNSTYAPQDDTTGSEAVTSDRLKLNNIDIRYG